MKLKLKFVIVLIAAAVILIAGNILYRPNAAAPVITEAEEGIIDLTVWDFDKDGSAQLDGYWEFYWNQLLEPSSFIVDKHDKPLEPAEYAKVPAPWKGILNKTTFDSKGAGTYHLRVKVNPGYAVYGIKTANIRMSNRLYVNGRMAGISGKPGLTPAESISRNVPYAAYFASEEDYIDIIIQVSDFDYLTGGIVQPIYFGTEKSISTLNLKEIILDIIVFSTLLMASFYFIGIFIFRRKDTALFYFSVYCIMSAFLISISGERVFLQLFPSFDFTAIMDMQNFFLFICCASVCLFINACGDHFFSKKILKFYLSVFLLFDMIILVIPYEVYAVYQTYMFLVAFSANLLIAYFLLKAMLKMDYGDLGKIGVQLLCLSSVLIIIHFAGSYLYNISFFHDNTASLAALLLFVLIISLFFSKRHSDAYNAVEALSESLIKIDKVKDEFLINTSREIKTPLHGIINITQSVLDSSKNSISDKHKEDLHFVVTVAKRLSSLINDIIDFQSIKSGNLHLNIRVFDISSSIKAVLEVLESMYQNKDISIINCVPYGEYFVAADENRVCQIMYNLAGNALKFTEQGEVRISAERKDSFVLVAVSDTGVGIKNELLHTIFEDFEHLSEIKSGEYPPSGLGLPIARHLVDHMGGKLWLEETEMGKGSKFCFTLPFAEVDEAVCIGDTEDAGIIAAGGDLSGSVWPGRALMKSDFSILIVEDEISDIKVIKDIFSAENCEIFTAYSGQQALEMVGNHRNISLVILDVMIPGMSGFEVCRKIREQYSMFDLPILLLTVKSTPEGIAVGLESGANDFLPRPFDAMELRARVRTILELKNSIRNRVRAETAFLQSQIKPHFVFNALSVITSLCCVDGVKAGRLLEEFSNYLRCSFDFDPYSSFVSLEKELSMVHSYVEIEKARFGERLKINYDIDENLNMSRIPALILQPLVENAIRHGILKRIIGGLLEIKAWQEGTSIKITVKDDGVGIPQEKLKLMLDTDKEAKGVGIRNIHQRLINIYGKGLEIESGEGKGTLVSLVLPNYKH